MQIYTSYYDNLKDDTKDMIPVMVSRTVPKYFKWEVLKIEEILPTVELVAGYKEGTISDEEYDRRYREEVLAKANRAEILKRLQAISDDYYDANIVLLCYENSTRWCHRHTLAEWLDCGVTEYEDKKINM